MNKKRGKLVENGVLLRKHEFLAIDVLLQYGDVEVIPLGRRNYERTPDFNWLGKRWELKSPRSRGKFTIRDAMRSAVRQSPNVIIDLRRIHGNTAGEARKVEKYFREWGDIQSIVIISRPDSLVGYVKKAAKILQFLPK